VGRELRGTRWSRGPPALKGDAPSMGNPIGGMRSARPSGKPTNRSGRPSTKLGLWGCGGNLALLRAGWGSQLGKPLLFKVVVDGFRA